MENRFFQWIIGELRGNILVFDKLESEGEDTYIVFKDGSRINERLVAPLNETNLTNKFMAEIDSPNNCWKFEEIPQKEEKPRVERDANTSVTYEIPSANDIARADLTSEGGVVNVTSQQKRSIKLIPPKPTVIKELPKNEIIEEVPKQKVEDIPKQEPKSDIDETDPVYILMSKSKKQDAEINMSLVISLPSKSLYDIAKESFEDGDQKFVEYIIHNVSVEEIKKSIKEAIINMYEQTYEQTETIDE